MNEDVSLQVVSAPKSSVTVITNKVFLHFGRWTVLISRALLRTAKNIILIINVGELKQNKCVMALKLIRFNALCSRKILFFPLLKGQDYICVFTNAKLYFFPIFK